MRCDLLAAEALDEEVNLVGQVSLDELELVLGYLTAAVGDRDVLNAVDHLVARHLVVDVNEAGGARVQDLFVAFQVVGVGELVRFLDRLRRQVGALGEDEYLKNPQSKPIPLQLQFLHQTTGPNPVTYMNALLDDIVVVDELGKGQLVRFPSSLDEYEQSCLHCPSYK